MEAPFRFKQFSICQDRCAMKVGTDGVLLGAWADVSAGPHSILDIGAGTGLVALMLAQRSTADQIDALEIDPNAFEQCVENFEASPWLERLFCYHASLLEFLEEALTPYDLIVSNPPFYTELMPGRHAGRDMARQNQSLPFEQLFTGAKKLLAPAGTFCTIIPHREEGRILELAGANTLYASRVTRIRGNSKAPVKRSLLEFTGSNVPSLFDEIVIETGRHEYTPAYYDLTKDFYLKM